MRTAFTAVLLVIAVVAALQLVALFVLRAGRDLWTRKHEARAEETRDLLFTALLGDPDEAESAVREIRSRRGREWRRVEDQAFRLLGKVKGESHVEIVALLVEHGAETRATRMARSWSAARRCRGAYRLGVLQSVSSVPVLLRLLDDPEFLVRRVAVRALGHTPAPGVSAALAQAAANQPALRRDALAAVARLGFSAEQELLQILRRAASLESGSTAAFAATSLGLLGSVTAVPALIAALDDAAAEPAFRAAAADALGLVGVPAAVPALGRALASGDRRVRVEAAEALGLISDPATAPQLAAAMTGTSRDLDRAAGAALLELGHAGIEELRASTSPYAREALAVHELKARV